MKVIILAGGGGARLGQLTEVIPKPMVLIGNKPMIWHIMKIYSYYGFTDFIICLGVKADVIKNYFNNYEIFNSDFTRSMESAGFSFVLSLRSLAVPLKLQKSGCS
jgi:glucose-1-phosphate cytidylyltransferase